MSAIKIYSKATVILDGVLVGGKNGAVEEKGEPWTYMDSPSHI